MIVQSGQFIKKLERSMQRNKIRSLEKRRIELIRDIQLCYYYKDQIIKFVQRLNYQYDQGLINYETYHDILNRSLENRKVEDWARYYDDCIKYYKYNLKICKEEIGKEEEREELRIGPLTLTLVILLIWAVGLFITRPEITGLFVGAGEKTQTYSENINLVINQNSSLEWIPKNIGVLNSVKISGSIIGEGKVKVYLDDKLILDRSLLDRSGNKITGFAVTEGEVISEENIAQSQIQSQQEQTQTEQVVVTEPEPQPSQAQNDTLTDSSESTPEAIKNITENITEEISTTIEENITVIENITIIENITEEQPIEKKKEIIISFRDICIETCLIELNKTGYNLRFEIENVTLNLDSITYEIVPLLVVQAPLINITNETLINVTDINISNVTFVNITINGTAANVTENLSIESALVWNYSVGKGKIKDDGIEFDGEYDYDKVKDSENIRFVNNSFAIEAKARIDYESSGIILSKFDYLDGRYFELGVNVEGTIFFDIGDSYNTITLETINSYNDGKDHKIFLIMNNSNAQLYVDDILQSQENTSILNDINSEVPISVGANTGYINWMKQTVNNFKGVIKDIKIYYREENKNKGINQGNETTKEVKNE